MRHEIDLKNILRYIDTEVCIKIQVSRGQNQFHYISLKYICHLRKIQIVVLSGSNTGNDVNQKGLDTGN